MPLKIVRQDITKMDCDAIVNSTNPSMEGAGGADAAIHEAAGPKLDAACKRLGGCPVGGVRLTKGYKLPCRYIIHTVGAVWKDGGHGEREVLASCYRNSLALAQKRRFKSVAFPVIGANTLGAPKKEAFRIAVDAIGSFLLENDMLVYLVVFGSEEYGISSRFFPDIESYIDDHYALAHREQKVSRRLWGQTLTLMEESEPKEAAPVAFAAPPPMPQTATPMDRDGTLSFIMEQIDESFSEMVLRKITEKGMTDAACYKRANLDRKLFSKLRSNPQYKPSKPTAIALAIALELPLEEAKDMLMKAGFALSHSSKFDLIVEYFIRNGNYNIFEINEALFAFDQSILGG